VRCEGGCAVVAAHKDDLSPGHGVHGLRAVL